MTDARKRSFSTDDFSRVKVLTVSIFDHASLPGQSRRTDSPPRPRRTRTNIEEAGYNVFNLDSEDVFIDLLTDSGTGTMSDEQWAAMMRGDEAYAGSDSFKRLQESVSDVMGFEKVVPAHQGRGAENVLYGVLVSEGDYVPNNTHFDTTRAHVVNNGGKPVDCPIDVAPDDPFQGNLAPDKVRELADEVGAENIPVLVVTITNNSIAGQPVSVENLREVADFADEIDATFVLDACRFAENAYFVRQREEEFADERSPTSPAKSFSYADAVVMSGKKEALVNIGGFVALREEVPGGSDGDCYEHLSRQQRASSTRASRPTAAWPDATWPRWPSASAKPSRAVRRIDRVQQVQELGDLLLDAGVPIYRRPAATRST